MRRNTITVTWVCGLALAAGLYATGPDRFLEMVLDVTARLQDGFVALVALLGAQAFDVVRSLAIALFVVFLVLGLLAAGRGLKARSALVAVSAVFLALVWRPHSNFAAPGSHWLGALLLAATGAGVMTRRLLSYGIVIDPSQAFKASKRFF